VRKGIKTSKLRQLLPLLLSFFLLSAISCKKSPTFPNAEELTRPVIWLNTFELSFTAYESGGNPEGQILEVKNSGKNTLEYTISDDADWLSVEPGSGTSSGQIVTHTILINKAGLAAQDAEYVANVTIASSEAYNNPQRLSVNLKVSPKPPSEIWVSTEDMSFAAKTGKNPSPQTLRIKNSGEGTLAYQITADAAWLTVSPDSGTSSGEEKSHTVSINSGSLAEGSYDGAITISSADASNSPQTVTVSLEVSSNPTPPPPSTNNRISVGCNPSSGRTGTTVSVPISIDGNLQAISTFGLELTFDANLFDYVRTSKGSLTGNWATVDGNLSGAGRVTLGGFAGSANAIPVGSVGTIVVVTLKVTGTGFSDGQQSQLKIQSYSDDIAGMKPQPASTTFTFRK
jgi:Viral BACON domain/Cohesin domain